MEENQKSKKLLKRDWIIVFVLFVAIITVLIVQFLNKTKAEEKQNKNLNGIVKPEGSISQLKLFNEFNPEC